MSVPVLQLRLALVGLFVTSAFVAAVGPLKNNHEVLGITRAATFEDIQYAYQKLAVKHQTGRNLTEPPEAWFVEIQHAYEAISNQDMQEDALRFVDYWGDISQLKDDMDLRRFSEFQPSGSPRLRMIVVMNACDDRHYEVFAASTKFGSKIRVGQSCQADLLSPSGQHAEFLTSLKLQRFPAVILFDPITRGMKVRYGLDGIGAEIERILSGELSTADKLGWLQEFDAQAYSSRCESKEENAIPCSSVFVIATSPELERRRADLVQALKPFNDACRKLSTTEMSAACFWLRLGRAPEWLETLKGKFAAVTGDTIVVGMLKGDPYEITMAPAGVVSGTEDQVTNWINSVLGNSESMQTLPSWPSLPKAVLPAEEPAEEYYSKLFRKASYHARCVFFKKCRATQIELMTVEFHLALQRHGLAEYYVQLMNLDSEMRAAAAGGVLLVFIILFLICKNCCCRRKSKTMSEEEACQRAEFLVEVSLRKAKGSKLGMSIEAHKDGGILIIGVDEGLLEKWNQEQPCVEKRICKGDRIIAVSSVLNGKKVRGTAHGTIVPILQKEDLDIHMIVERSRRDTNVQRIVGTCNLEGFALQGNVQLAPVDGSGLNDFVVTSLGPAVLEFNAQKAEQGACCTQQLAVGDRIISVRSNTNVQAKLDDVSPQLCIIRWRPVASIRSHTVEVSMPRQEDEIVGMQIRPRMAEPKQMEVLEVVQDNPKGILARWNSTAGNPQICKGDRIVSVGGKSDLAGVKEQLGLKLPQVSICFERWIETKSGSDAAILRSDSKLQPEPEPGNAFAAPAMLPLQSPLGVSPSVATQPPMPAIPAQIGASLTPQIPQAPLSNYTPAPPPPLVGFQAPMAPSPPFTAKPPGEPKPAVAAVAANNSFPLLPVVAAVLLGGIVVVAALNGGEDPRREGKTPPQVALPPEARVFLEKINPGLYMEVAALLLLLGLLMTINFIRNEVWENSMPGCGAGILQQLCGAAAASTLLGFGSTFLLAWAGAYA